MADTYVDTIQRLLAEGNHLAERIDADDTQWRNAIFRASQLQVRVPGGGYGVRDVVWHNGGAGVLAIRDDGCMCVVRQWRVALGRATLEIPAGKIDSGEDGMSAAARELAEETGLKAARFSLIAEAAGSPGFTNEITRIYQAHELSMGVAHPDPDEFVEVIWIEPEALIAAAKVGIIQDAKTIIAAYAAMIDTYKHQATC